MIDELTPGTTYYFIVKSQDESDNLTVANEEDFTTDEEVVVDETGPVLSNLLITTTSTTATITWDTDEEATSKVTYADSPIDTASSTDSVSESAFVTSHSLELTGLATSTQNFLKVESEDEAENATTSGEEDFTTGS